MHFYKCFLIIRLVRSLLCSPVRALPGEDSEFGPPVAAC